MKLELLRYQNLLLENLVESKRYLYNEINDNIRLQGIVGLRGVGKTTILLQKLKIDKEKSIYFSLDNPRVSSMGLFNIVEKLYFDYGIRSFYIDEIHKYSNWNQELKNIYDSFPKAKILFSGSSSIDIVKGTYDLSRRAIILKLNPLSFREYLNINYKKEFQKISLDDIFGKKQNIEDLLLELSKNNIPILDEFDKYLDFGEFPFFLEGSRTEYILRLENVINKIIYEDIVNFYKLKTENIIYLKEILYFIINTKPGLFSSNSIAKFLKISNDSASKYVDILKEIGLIISISAYGNISQNIRKAKKVYLSITNINSIPLFKLSDNQNIGRVREGFVVSNFNNINTKINYSQKGDFVFTLGDRQITIEVGGKNKTNKQIKDIKNSFIVSDGISIINKNKIPLWLFGFLY